MNTQQTVLTPMMAQWHSCKEEAKEALLLFRLGDFYEAFEEDAKIISKELGVTLTARQGTAMCGVPFHTVETYIDKLLAKGYKVAIAEQIDDPKMTKGLVRRKIQRIITPGTTLSSSLLSDKKNNFFASLSIIGSTYGLSYIDVTTGEFFALEFEEEHLLFDAIHRIRPAEILAEKKFIAHLPHFLERLSHFFPFLLNEKEGCDPKIALAALDHHLDRAKKPLIRGKLAATSAAGMLLLYLKEELSLSLDQVQSIDLNACSEVMGIDHSTLEHLEIGTTLLEFLDETMTPMGARLLSQWLKAPSLKLEEIKKRQETISFFLSHWEEAEKIREMLNQVKDLERLMMKTVTQIATPRDLLALGHSLKMLFPLKEKLLELHLEEASDLFNAKEISEKIISAISPTPPIRIGEGEIFLEGFDKELDRLKALSKESISWMNRYQVELRESTGIKTLKVGYTKAFGYFIEVSHSQGTKVPDFFQRRQTLVNAERFITEELKSFEHQVLTAEERAKALEMEYFLALRSEVASFSLEVHKSAKLIARIDLLLSLAKIAQVERWKAPIVDDSNRLEIQSGRHPIVERAIGKNFFIANDTLLEPSSQMMLITGPNMAGKSTYIRQVAVIVILAQIGSFVPADFAHIGLVDQLFSRIGASDDLQKGQSTFMVEMAETANILHHATSRSLVILDEIGRGTSTYDGISIAWAVAQYLLTQHNRQAKTLFATHYWELTKLAEEYPHARNFQTAIQEKEGDLLFLRKIVPGGTDKSYGIHVAKLAGLPLKVIKRAEEMLKLLEKGLPRKKVPQVEQLSLFSPPPPLPPKPVEKGSLLIEELKQLDLNQLSPIAALEILFRWKNEHLS